MTDKETNEITKGNIKPKPYPSGEELNRACPECGKRSTVVFAGSHLSVKDNHYSERYICDCGCYWEEPYTLLRNTLKIIEGGSNDNS